MGAFMVSGFAITLFIGVALSMFSAITISRSLLRVSVQITKSPSVYGVWK
jgi:preprotein translocase subunit SecD